MTRTNIADRLVNYGDAIAAFSVVNSLAFLVGLTDAEVRCSIAHLPGFVAGALIVLGSVLTFAVAICRRVENRLRAEDAPLPLDVASILRWFFLARLAVIWLSVGTSIFLARMAFTDPACLAPAA